MAMEPSAEDMARAALDMVPSDETHEADMVLAAWPPDWATDWMSL